MEVDDKNLGLPLQYVCFRCCGGGRQSALTVKNFLEVTESIHVSSTLGFMGLARISLINLMIYSMINLDQNSGRSGVGWGEFSHFSMPISSTNGYLLAFIDSFIQD